MLSSDDPVRVFQDFATLDLLSGGRAEIMAGRGSFIESFPLFGYDLNDYDALFDEKLRLLLAVRDARAADLVGRAHAADRRARRLPAAACRTRCRSGSRSAARPSRRSAPARSACRWRSRSSAACPSGSRRSPSSTARRRGRRATTRRRRSASTRTATSPTPRRQALDESFPHAAAMMNAIGRERGWPPMSRADYDAAATLRGANFVGSPQQVVEKILFQHELFGHDRFLVQFAVGSLPHDRMLRSIELLGTEVAPAVRARARAARRRLSTARVRQRLSAKRILSGARRRVGRRRRGAWRSKGLTPRAAAGWRPRSPRAAPASSAPRGGGTQRRHRARGRRRRRRQWRLRSSRRRPGEGGARSEEMLRFAMSSAAMPGVSVRRPSRNAACWRLMVRSTAPSRPAERGLRLPRVPARRAATSVSVVGPPPRGSRPYSGNPPPTPLASSLIPGGRRQVSFAPTL